MSAAGRACPLRYRYGASAIAEAPAIAATTLYVVGGLYGNLAALDALAGMLAAEDEDVTVEINTSELAKKLEESGEYDMAIRLRRSSRPPGPSN